MRAEPRQDETTEVTVTNDEYEEVEAIIRRPKGKRLADSSKSDGWSVGFTPKTSEHGPEYVEIKIKDSSAERDDQANGGPGRSHWHVPEQDSSSEKNEDDYALQYLVLLGIAVAIGASKPFLTRLLEKKIIPFYHKRKNAMSAFKAKRTHRKHPAALEEAAPGCSELAIQQEKITSDEARMHFVQALLAQRFVEEKMRLLSTSSIDDQKLDPRAIKAIKKLSPREMEPVLMKMLSENPTLLTDLVAAQAEGALPSPIQPRRSLES